ncbi:MAG: hypothetical protein H0V27_12370 [Pyrinomonadaceae bacterium]|jgi:hypothetical protein|nr:hypothetical protein [Pyrinomonadaceae bacterium]
MKALSLALAAVLLCQSASLAFATPARQTNPQETLVRLTNKEVMEMVRSGLSADVIVAKIKRSRCNFDTFPGVLAEMKRNGVPEAVILAMIEAPYGAPSQTTTPTRTDTPSRSESSETSTTDETNRVPTRQRYVPQSDPRMRSGSRVYIVPMEGNLHGFIAAEIMKKKLPVTIVTEEATADFIIVGSSLKGDNRWYHSAFGTGQDKNEGNIQVVSVANRSVIWAGEAGDRSLWWGTLARGGQRKIAGRLVSKLKSDLF